MPSILYTSYLIFLTTLNDGHYYPHYKWRRSFQVGIFYFKADNVLFPLQNIKQYFNSILNLKGIFGYDSIMFTKKE